MIVVDASAVTELLLRTPRGVRVEARLFRDGDTLHAPHVLDLEVVRALRRLTQGQVLSEKRAEEAIADLLVMDVLRHAHHVLVGRIWQLRANLTVYDAAYVALAEGLDATVVTCDGPLGAAPGHLARVEVVR